MSDTKPKYSVLTYIYNNYEIVHEVKEKDPDAEYILVTDDSNLKSDTWTVVCSPRNELSLLEKIYDVRFRPFKYVHSDLVVRVDGSIGINKSFSPLIDAFINGNYDRCVMIHPERNTFIAELDAWIRIRNYNPVLKARFIDMIQRMGYDLNYKGLFQSCFEIVKNNEINRDINNMTLGLLRYVGGDDMNRINQVTWSFVINHFFSDKIKLLPVSESIITNGKFMQWYWHNTNNKIVMKRNTIEPMMFNTPCVPWDYIYNK